MAKLIRAAGGLLWRETARGLEIMLVHRERYDDWSLPKGKLNKEERWEDAALREVLEELAYRSSWVSLPGLPITRLMPGRRWCSFGT